MVEQLVVLSLIVILVGFGAVRMVQTNRQNELDHASKGIEFVFRFLQMKSIQDARVYKLVIGENKQKLMVMRQLDGSLKFEPVKSNLVRSFRVGNALSLEGERGSEFLFYPDGSSSRNRLIINNESEHQRLFFRLKNRIGTIEVTRA